MMQMTFDFAAKPPKPLTAKQQRAAAAAAEKARNEVHWARQRARDLAEARAYWKVGMVVSMPLWATVRDSTQTYVYCLPGVIEAIADDKADVRLYVAPEYGSWMENYPMHGKLAVDVPLPDLGRYALNQHLVQIVAEGKLSTGCADVARRVREWHAGGYKGARP